MFTQTNVWNPISLAWLNLSRSSVAQAVAAKTATRCVGCDAEPASRDSIRSREPRFGPPRHRILHRKNGRIPRLANGKKLVIWDLFKTSIVVSNPDLLRNLGKKISGTDAILVSSPKLSLFSSNTLSFLRKVSTARSKSS